MKTVTIQIGNTDNKLTQHDWSKYVATVAGFVRQWAAVIHFAGGPPTDSPFQNFCWVFAPKELSRSSDERVFFHELALIRSKFCQESVAVTVGDTQLI